MKAEADFNVNAHDEAVIYFIEMHLHDNPFELFLLTDEF